MTYPKSESLLLEPVARYLRRRSFSWQQHEVQFYDYRMDLYAFSLSKDLTIAVELKLTNWRRAFQQALIYQLCSDWVFIALPFQTIPRVDTQLLGQYGIGLLSVLEDGRCRRVLFPTKSDEVRSDYRSSYIDLLKAGIGGASG